MIEIVKVVIEMVKILLEHWDLVVVAAQYIWQFFS